MKNMIAFLFGSIVCAIVACGHTNTTPQSQISIEENNSDGFKSYWYNGEAEITSYTLEQARYGEIREGNAVLIYVTEDFLPKEQVKADDYSKDNVPVFKLNATKKFLTGVYPYSIMQSTFYPVSDDQHAIKVSASIQEWCGHTYLQLNNRKKFEINAHSYFEGEADQQFELDKTHLENEVWNKVRINPDGLPIGDIEMIPAMEYIRLKHVELKAYKAKATLNKEGDQLVYTLKYPELDRTLSIRFNSSFPHVIDSWSETFKSGFGANAQKLTSTAKRIKTMRSKYWSKNGNVDVSLRDSLGITN